MIHWNDRLLTASEAKELDEQVIRKTGISSLSLMRRAARDFVEELFARYAKYLYSGTVAVFFHHGKNGGDALEIGRLLLRRGIDTRLYFTGNIEKLSEETRAVLRDLAHDKEQYCVFSSTDISQYQYIQQATIIIDGIFGVGFHGALSGVPLAAADWINSAKGIVVAVDMPTGVDASCGTCSSGAVLADLTITFGTGKVGQYVMPGARYCGQIVICPIGFPEEILSHTPDLIFKNSVENCSQTFFKLPKQGHKGVFGRILHFAGSVGMSGAAAFSARGALLSGAGTVTIASVKSNYSILGTLVPEAMQIPCSEINGMLTSELDETILTQLTRMQAILFGPGLGRTNHICDLLLQLMKKWSGPLVLDADGLFAIRAHIDSLRSFPGPKVLTPHDGEYAFLMGTMPTDDRLLAARQLSKKTASVVVLKGPHTVISCPDGTTAINETGGPGLATGGTGDVLAGMITGLLGRGMDAFSAARCAVWTHGKAGDLAQKEGAWFSVTASRVLEKLPAAYQLIAPSIE